LPNFGDCRRHRRILRAEEKKSDEEIRCLEQSAEISSIGFKAHLTAWRPGITEREYCSSVVHAMDAAGAEPPTFCVSSPVRSSAHGLPELKRGDCIVSEATQNMLPIRRGAFSASFEQGHS
jgi:Xaa-Pro aminopeptidase